MYVEGQLSSVKESSNAEETWCKQSQWEVHGKMDDAAEQKHGGASGTEACVRLYWKESLCDAVSLEVAGVGRTGERGGGVGTRNVA